MKKTFIALAAMLLSLAVFAQPVYTVNSNRTPGSALLTQNVPGTRIILMQNPVRGVINFQISNPVNTKYEISLYSTNGEKVTSILYDHPAGISVKSMDIPAGVKGMYYLVVRGENERHSIQVLIE